MKGVFLIIFCSILSIIIDAQDHYELIVQFNKNGSFQKIEYFNEELVIGKRLLSSRLNIWKIQLAKTKRTKQDYINTLKSFPEVKFVQGNRKITMREILSIDDPLFLDQWSLSNTGQTGGLVDADIDLMETIQLVDSLGIELENVVVAVIDNGFDLSHEDINYWVNFNEIPNNGVDDDENGYIDDYYGWNAYSDSSEIPVGSHGTHVAGIISAISNNNFGIAGISNAISVLPIAGSSPDEATVIAAYSYAFELKLQYLESSGERGANIVVTNSSFGIDKADPKDYPIWSAMYDSLGKYGVLSCAATANSTWDVDVEGDMPTACESEYLVAVTNTTHLDKKNSSAAYGKNSIDLGAPGTSIISTTAFNSFGYKTGTSMASPITASCAAFLYSLCTNNDFSLAKKPLLIKNYLTQGVDIITDLVNKTTSNGRLNLFNSAKMYIEEFLRINTEYNSGWNIVSIPNTESSLRNDIFSSRSSNLFEFENGYTIIDSLEFGKGYWVKFDEVTNESYENLNSNYSIKVKEGWNLIGSKATDLLVTSITSDPTGLINSSFFGFTNGYEEVEILKPGRGYWVNISGEGILQESEDFLLQKLVLSNEIDFAFEIKASNGVGSSQIITIGIDSTATDRIDIHLGEQELPPPPPSEIFFIRFNLPNSFISSYSDIRFGELNGVYTYEHELQFQLGADADELTLAWEQPEGVVIIIQDMFGGIIIEEDFMPGSNEFILTNLSISSLKIIAAYSELTSVEEDNKQLDFILYQNYPNPFNPTTIIEYSVPNSVFVSMKIYDILGREIKTLVNEDKSAGRYEVSFDGSELSSGIYIYGLKAGDFYKTRKLLLLK